MCVGSAALKCVSSTVSNACLPRGPDKKNVRTASKCVPSHMLSSQALGLTWGLFRKKKKNQDTQTSAGQAYPVHSLFLTKQLCRCLLILRCAGQLVAIKGMGYAAAAQSTHWQPSLQFYFQLSACDLRSLEAAQLDRWCKAAGCAGWVQWLKDRLLQCDQPHLSCCPCCQTGQLCLTHRTVFLALEMQKGFSGSHRCCQGPV